VWDDDDRSGFAEAVEAADGADIAVLVMGDRAGMFGRGTVGEGCDRDDLELPGVQRELVEAVLKTGTPVVLVLVTGRPYAVDWAITRCAAVLQAFFPGEEGSGAIAGVLSGRVNPSGKLPVSLPRSAGAQPYSYLHPMLGEGRRGHQPVQHSRGPRSATACRIRPSHTPTSRCRTPWPPMAR
jgi:beta-glucosidase